MMDSMHVLFLPLECTHWNLDNPKVNDGIRRWGFSKWLEHNNGVFLNGISAYMKEPPALPQTFNVWVLTEREVHELGSGPSPDHKYAGASLLEFQALELRNKCLLFKPKNKNKIVYAKYMLSTGNLL
jgi:hypothetical protein